MRNKKTDSFFNFLFGIIQTTRFVKSLVVSVVLVFLSAPILYGVASLLFFAFTYTFNDWVDAEKDKIGHPNRAIPSNKITRRQSLYLSLFFLLGGILFALLFTDYIFGFFIIYTLSFLYSFVLKPLIPVVATFVWSTAVAILFVQSFSDNLTFYVAVMIIVYAYELVLDYRDIESDRYFCKTPTLSRTLGRKTMILSAVLFVVGITVLIRIW